MERTYELVLILDPEAKAEEVEKLLGKIKKIVLEAKGEVLGSKDWGKKELAYPVKKRGMGIFQWLELSLPVETVASFRTKLNLDEEIIRFLLIVKETPSTKPAAVKKAVKGGKNVVKVA